MKRSQTYIVDYWCQITRSWLCLYVDILFGTSNEKNFDNQVSGGYIDAFKDGKFVASDGTGYSFEQFKNEFFKKDIKERIKVLEVGAAPGIIFSAADLTELNYLAKI